MLEDLKVKDLKEKLESLPDDASLSVRFPKVCRQLFDIQTLVSFDSTSNTVSLWRVDMKDWIKPEECKPTIEHQFLEQMKYSNDVLIKLKGYPHPFVGQYCVDMKDSKSFWYNLSKNEPVDPDEEIESWFPIKV